MSSNLHVNLDEANKHTPKGFDSAVNNTFLTKDESGLSTYKERMMLDKAINFVDGTLAPPTTANGDIYVLTGSGTVEAGWGGADFDDWVIFQNGIAVTITPLAGYLCYDTTASQWKEYDGADWVDFGGGVTNLSEGTSTTTTVDVDSDTGTNATLQPASTLRAGVMSKAKFDEVEVNNAKVTNATHTGEVTGSGALTVDSTAISNKTALGSLAGTEEFLINDGGTLKKVLASNVGGQNFANADLTLDANRVHKLGTADSKSISFQNHSSEDIFKYEAIGTGQRQGRFSVFSNTLEACRISAVSSEQSFINGKTNIGSNDATDYGARLAVVHSSGGDIKTLNSNGTLTHIRNQSDRSVMDWFIAGGATAYNRVTIVSGDSNFFSLNTGIGYNSSNVSEITARLVVRGNNALGTSSNTILKNNVNTPIFDVRNDGSVGIGLGGAMPSAKTHIKGNGSGSGTTAFLVENSTGQDIANFRDDNAISFYGGVPTAQATTGVAAATFVANTSGIVDDTATFDGYTIGQITTALRAIGILQ
jgi:hypothetical protein